MVADLAFRPGKRTFLVRGEEFGGAIVDALEGREEAVLGCLLRGADSDALQRLFASTAAGATSGERLVTYPGTVREGDLLSARSVALLVSPLNARSHRALYLPNAFPLVDESAALQWSLSREQVVGVLFYAARTSATVAYRYGLLEDIVL